MPGLWPGAETWAHQWAPPGKGPADLGPQPQTAPRDSPGEEELHNTQRFALACGGDTVAPLRVCSEISLSHDFLSFILPGMKQKTFCITASLGDS